MNSKIEQWSNLVIEALDEPSYNDIMIIAKKVGKAEDMMTAEDYENLSDQEKEDIFKTRQLVSQINVKEEPLVDILNTNHLGIKADAQASILKDQEKEHVYVHYIEQSFNHKNVEKWRETLANSSSPDKLFRLKPGEYSIDNNDVEVCEDMESAKKVVSERMKEIEKQFNVKPVDFREVSKEEIPFQILEIDPNAIGFKYQSFEAEYDQKEVNKKGVQQYYKHGDEIKTPNEWAKELDIQPQLFRKYVSNGQLTDYERVNKDGSKPDDDKTPISISKDMVFTYWIYKATHQVARVNSMVEIAKALENLDVSWTERGDMTRKAKERKDSQKIKYASTKDVQKALKDLNDLNKHQDQFSFGDIDTTDDTDDNDGFTFNVDPNGDAIDLSANTEEPLPTDDEIKAAYDNEGKSGKHSDDEDVEDDEDAIERDKKEQKRGSFDYGEQSDDDISTGSDDSDPSSSLGGLKSAWANQDDEEIRKQNKEREKNTAYSLRGVPLTKRQFQKIQELAKTEKGRTMIPKTKEEVEEWIKNNP